MAVNITKLVVERARAPRDGQIFIRDKAVTGFALRVTAKGAKSFIWEGRIRGRMRRITLGGFPALTVSKAREKALQLKAAIIDGDDPSEIRKRKLSELTFRDLEEAYLERHARVKKRSWKRDALMLDGYLSKLRARRITDISSEEVARIHAIIGRDHGRYAANRTLALLRTMLNLALDWGYITGRNPAQAVTMFPEEKRERFLTPEELRRVMRALETEPNSSWRAYFFLSLILGPRKSELLSARWADIDFEQRTWRIPTTKAGRPHVLPLPGPALEVLASLLQGAASEFVFPGIGATGHLVEPKKAWQRIRSNAGIADVRIHDLRRTLGSFLAAQGYSLPLIGKALNHSNVSTTAIYARLDRESVSQALEKNAAFMLRISDGPKQSSS
jgi:integrase